MVENIRLAFQGIWSHKMRSFLTMLGIIIGIAAIIAIVSTIKGTNEQIEKNLIGSGNNEVKVQLFQGDNSYEIEYNGIPDGVPVIQAATLKQVQDIANVRSAALYRTRQVYDGVYYLNNALSGGIMMGIGEEYFDSCSYRIVSGRGFTGSDYTNYRKVAVVDTDAAKSLFQGEDALGKTIEISGEPFVVIGEVEESMKFEPVINSMEDYETYQTDSSGKVFITEAAWPIVYRYDEPQNLVLQTEDTASMTTAGKAAAEILNQNLNVEDTTIKYKAEDLLEQARDIQNLSSSTNMMLIWIAGISLIVGGIGVMNIMLVSVTERTQEIGLKKAIGARKNRILAQFLTEAAVLTSMGGVIGVVVGIVLAEVISRLSDTPVAISVPSVIAAVAFSMVIGIVFGMLPSYKAANLNPIDALRHE
ncbi:MAG: ABC transporter permease [Eubacterium sp.]|nr:ABC transporter permease [Eubacterium sp.]